MCCLRNIACDYQEKHDYWTEGHTDDGQRDTVNVEIFGWGNFRVFRAFVFFAKITPT